MKLASIAGVARCTLYQGKLAPNLTSKGVNGVGGTRHLGIARGNIPVGLGFFYEHYITLISDKVEKSACDIDLPSELSPSEGLGKGLRVIQSLKSGTSLCR